MYMLFTWLVLCNTWTDNETEELLGCCP